MKRALLMVSVLLLATSAVSAQVLQWQGVNSSTATSLEQINVDEVTNWKVQNSDPVENRLPTVDDEVQFLYNSPNFVREDLAIPGTSAFECRKLSLMSSGSQDQLKMPLYLQKSLTVESIYLRFGYTSSGQGDDNLRIGSPDTTAALLLRQADQDAVTGTISLTGSVGTANIDFSSLTPYDPTDAITEAASRSARRTEILGLINAQSAATGVSAAGTGDITVSATAAGSANFIYVVQGSGTFRTTGTKANQPLNYVAGLDYTVSTLTLTGTEPVDLATDTTSTSTRTKWRTIRLYPDCKLIMNNPNLTLRQQTQAATAACSGALGGSGGFVELPAVAGTVTLADPGIRSDGVLNVGQNRLMVRSDQTYLNPSGISFIRMTSNNNGLLLDAIDGQPLNNMGQVAMILDGVLSTTCSMPPGTFQGWIITGSLHYGRPFTLDLTGDVSLTGSAVLAGNNTTASSVADPDYSLRMDVGQSLQTTFCLNGYDLTTAKGILLRNTGKDGGDMAQLDARTVAAAPTDPTIVTIGGNLDYLDSKAECLAGGATETRKIGILGDPLTQIRLSGHFRSPLRSLSNVGLTRATMEMSAGTPAEPQTIEVMGNVEDAFGSSTATIGKLLIGNGTDPAYVQLVNANQNDGGLVWEEEVLLARNLRVNAGATLDCNLGLVGGVKISPPNKFVAETQNYDIGYASGEHTIVGKKGSFTFNIDEMGGTTAQIFAELVNLHTAETGVVATWSGYTAWLESEGDGHDDFFMVFGNMAFRNGTTGKELVAAGLFVDPAGTMDLNTGRLLVAGDKVMEFYSDGDQTAAWNAFKNRVIDSSNPDLDFEAVTVDIQDYELDEEADPIYITVWAVASGGQLDPIDASVAIAPNFVYQNNLTTGNRHKAVMTVTVNNVVGDETYTVTVDGIVNNMISVAAGATDLTKNLVGGTRNVNPDGLCSFNVTVTDSLGRSTAAAIPASVMVRKLGDIDGNGFVEPTDKGLLNSKLNGVSVPGVAFEAFDLDGNGFAEPTDKGLLNNILNGVTVN